MLYLPVHLLNQRCIARVLHVLPEGVGKGHLRVDPNAVLSAAERERVTPVRFRFSQRLAVL